MTKSSFLRGMGSVIDLFPQDRGVVLPLPTHSDEEAFRKDLQQVGSDIYAAIESTKKSDSKLFRHNDDKEMEQRAKF